MAGISSTAGASWAPPGVTRVLLRIAVLVGLVVCGWLLASATGLAQEAAADEVQADEAGPRDWVHVALTHDEGSEPARAADTPAPKKVTGSVLAPLVETPADELLPVGEVLRIPVQATAPDVVVKIVQPVVTPVADHVQGTGTPERINQPPPSRLTAEADQSAGPAAKPVGALPGPAIPAPQVDVPSLGALTPLSTAEDPAADVLAESSAAVDQRSTPLAPASPLGTTGMSCPAGPAGPTTAAPGAHHAATLDDGVAKADLALAARRLSSGAGGLPRCPSQQPSTSPD